MSACMACIRSVRIFWQLVRKPSSRNYVGSNLGKASLEKVSTSCAKELVAASKTPPRSNVTNPAQHRMSCRLTSQENCIQEHRRDDFEFPTLEKLEQGSRNIEPIAALVSTRLVLSRAALLLPTVAAASCRDYLFTLQ